MERSEMRDFLGSRIALRSIRATTEGPLGLLMADRAEEAATDRQ
jgi:hypothetical protein